MSNQSAAIVDQILATARRAQDKAPSSEEISERNQRLKMMEFRATGVPEQVYRFVELGRDERGNVSRETDAWAQLCRALAAGKRLIVLSGEPGTGKTYAAARWAAQEPSRSRWVSAVDYCALPPWSERRGAFGWTSWLVVDDLGLEEERLQNRIESLLYDRHANGGITVCTTNLAARDFAKAYDKRIISRLKEIGRWVECTQQERNP